MIVSVKMSEEREQECGIEEETMRKKGLALILQDLKQKELIPLKMIFFLLMGGKRMFLD